MLSNHVTASDGAVRGDALTSPVKSLTTMDCLIPHTRKAAKNTGYPYHSHSIPCPQPPPPPACDMPRHNISPLDSRGAAQDAAHHLHRPRSGINIHTTGSPRPPRATAHP